MSRHDIKSKEHFHIEDYPCLGSETEVQRRQGKKPRCPSCRSYNVAPVFRSSEKYTCRKCGRPFGRNLNRGMDYSRIITRKREP